MKGWCPACLAMVDITDVRTVDKQGRTVAVGNCEDCRTRAMRIVVGD